MSKEPSSHRIRLRGPWQFSWLSGEASVGTMQHPEEWRNVVGERAGTLELTRRFHTPTNIDADEEVFAVLTGVCGTGEVLLNDQRAGVFDLTRTTWEFRLPRTLPRYNALTIVISFAAASSEKPLTGLYDLVVLEIRRTAK